MPQHSARVRRRRRQAGVLLLGVATAVTLSVVALGGSGRPAGTGAPTRPGAATATSTGRRDAGTDPPAPAPTTSERPAPATSASTAPAATTTPTTLVASATLPPPGNGTLPQTTAEPSADTPAFHAEMTLLWDAIRTGRPKVAMPAFFPEPAYLQVKALDDDAADWTDRLEAHFDLDVDAAHRLLGPGAGAAKLVEVLVPSRQAAWIPPGACYNKLGYWHVPGSRLVYDEGGHRASIGIASLISWRGYWYVVHFGAVLPPAGRGVVDDPEPGTGSYGPPGGC